MNDEEYLDQLERQICETITEIRQRHALELEPYFKRLCDLRAMRPSPPTILIPYLQALEAGLIKP